jgi:alcohol dehydrogenase
MDCAKAMAAAAAMGLPARECAGLLRDGAETVPIVAVPTTAGTGSEVTLGAVITDTEKRAKITVKGPQLAPKVALLDPGLTLSMPPSLTAATGMDALTHAVEAFTVRNAHPLTDAAALYAVERIFLHLQAAVANGADREARTGMLLGSTLAGIAFSRSDVGAVHCIAEALGGMYDLPHGVCNAVMLPAVMRFNMEYCRDRYARLAVAMGLPPGEPEQAAASSVEAVERLARDVGLPPFSAFAIDPADVPRIAARSVENGSNASNPRPMAAEDYEELLRTMQGEGETAP